LRRLSPVTFYAALGELPRGALNIKTRRNSCPTVLLLEARNFTS